MKRFSLSAVLLSLLTFTTTAAALQQQNEATPLEANKPIERKIVRGEVHSYNLTLAPGSYALVEVDQRGTNSVVDVFVGDKQIRHVDMAGNGEAETISLLGDSVGSYRLKVKVSDESGQDGSYTITVKELRTATEDDSKRVDAQQLGEQGMALLIQQTAQARQQALEKFQQSAKSWHAVKDSLGEATTLYFQGYTYNLMEQPQKAIYVATEGLPLAKAAGKPETEAWLLDTIGSAYSNRGERQKALEFFHQALKLRPEKDRAGRQNTLNNMGIVYYYLGDRDKALQTLNEVVVILKELGDRRKEATVLGNICVIAKNSSDKKSLEYCTESVAIKHELHDRSGEATSLNNLGSAYGEAGEYQKALECWLQSLAIHKSLGELSGEGIALNNIGWVYAVLGDREKAIDYYTQALVPLRKLDYKPGVATLLSNIGVNYAEMGDFKKALEFHLQVLPIRIETNERPDQAITLNNIGGCYSNLGDKQKALEYYNRAIELHRQIGNTRELSTTLTNAGTVYRDIGDVPKALEYLNEALKLTRTVGDKNREANTLSHLARLERDRGNLKEARKLIEEAITAIESLRINTKSQQLRASFLASFRKYYDLDIDVLMRLHQQQPSAGFDAAALQVSEKSRARSLLELLREARAEIKQGVDPTLIEREGKLRRTIAEKAERQTRLLSGKPTEQQVTAAAQEIDDLTAEYEQLQARIRQESPRYAALTEPVPLDAKQIRTQVVDADTVLLEYALGEDKSFVWAVTPDSVKSFQLPARTKIEEVARRFYALLTARSQGVPNETLAQRKQRLDEADTEYPRVAANLSDMLLGPLAAELKQKRLVIVAEGVLQYVPFAALPSPGVQGKATAWPLIVDHEIVNLPSASVLALLRQEFANRKPANKAVAVLADPVFSPTDPRLTAAKEDQQAAHAEASPADDVQRSASEAGVGELTRLRFSRQEADEIARLAGHNPNLRAVDFAASRAAATDAQLSDYRIVHFATHGLINNEHPDLSGIVLSLVDKQGHPQNGFLRLYDIYNLKLDADLVVLSACQTALGKQINGEGLVGLTRGFMYAGAPRVVASFWRIDDRATADMMKRFYQSMFKDGLQPAAALRAAQVSMLQDPRWQAPHYWAAFTIQGDWAADEHR